LKEDIIAEEVKSRSPEQVNRLTNRRRVSAVINFFVLLAGFCAIYLGAAGEEVV